MTDLSKIRDQINDIDEQIIKLWKERMALSLLVAEYKKENNLSILDEQRENELLDRISGLAGEDLEDYSRELYSEILRISRDYQERRIKGDL